MSTDGSKSLYEETLKITPGGVSSPVRAFKPHPIFADKGNGCMITDVDGNEYVDFCMAYGPLILGHSPSGITEAVKAQLEKGSVFGMPSEAEYGLIKKITSKLPCAEMVRLTNSGTEATMHAIRLARGYTGKNTVIKIDGGFHGANDSLIMNGKGDGLESVPFSKGVTEGTVKYTKIARYNDIESFSKIIEESDDIAAVIIEPIMGNAGVIMPEKGFLEDLRKLCTESGTVLIFDEVITGFRVAEGGAQDLFGITPDLCTLGKIIGGGFPAGAVAGKKEIMERFAPFGDVYQAGTFSGNPITAVAGNAMLDLLTPSVYDGLTKYTESIVKGINDCIQDAGENAVVNSAPSMFQIFFDKKSVKNGADGNSSSRTKYFSLFNHMLSKGIYMPPASGEVNFVSAAHDSSTIDLFVESFEEFLRGNKE